MSRRGECIYKRKDGRWEARYVKEITFDGAKKYGSVYARSYKEVKEKQQQRIFQPIVSAIQTTQNTRLSIVADSWLQSVKNQIKKSSWQKYQSLIENHIKISLGDMSLKFITTKTVEQFTDIQLKSGKIGGNALSRKTVNDILIVLGMIFDYIYESYGITMPKIKLLREIKKDTRVLDKDEQSKLLDALYCDMDIYKFGVLLSLYTGLRIGELCALDWSDIKDDLIVVNKTMQRLKDDGGGTRIFINPPKSNCSKRIIPLPEFLKSVIHQFRKSDGFVLSSNTKRYIEPRLMQIKFEKI
ncbi:MAG: tyrosine-type recombinase/integrase family protein, partial [Clostridia bacterium]|nr:tyrosine-type recombinase/integrase family protein [Clostridia bacterium]